MVSTGVFARQFERHFIHLVLPHSLLGGLRLFFASSAAHVEKPHLVIQLYQVNFAVDAGLGVVLHGVAQRGGRSVAGRA